MDFFIPHLFQLTVENCVESNTFNRVFHFFNFHSLNLALIFNVLDYIINKVFEVGIFFHCL